MRRLGPWLPVSAVLWLLLISMAFWFAPPSEEFPNLKPVSIRRISNKQWMENRTVKKQAKAKKLVRTEAPEKKKERTEPPEPKPPEKPDGQIVDIAMPEREEAPDKADYVSQYNSKVKKQTKARDRAPADAVAPKRQKKGMKRPEQKIGRSEDRLVINMDPKPFEPGINSIRPRLLIPKLKMSTKLDLKPDAEKGRHKNKDDQDRNLKGNADRLKMIFKVAKSGQNGKKGLGESSNIPKSLLPDLETSLGIAGAPMNDYLKDVEEGEETWLNTKAFKYATFYNRVKRQVAKRWDPASAQRRYDPTFSIYGYKSRRTVIFITLDYEGNLENAEVFKSSGVDFLDQEAVSAVSRAAPFPNPPPGILEGDGKVKFPFGFYFELTRSGLRMTGYKY